MRHMRKLAVLMMALLLWQGAAAQPKSGKLWKKVFNAVENSQPQKRHAAAGMVEKISQVPAKDAATEGLYKLLGLRAAWQKKKALQESFEKNIHYSVFQILDADKMPLGTGFVFIRPDGSGQIWAAAAGHLTKQIGQKVPVRFYIGDGEYLPAFFIVRARGSVGLHNPDMVLMEVPAWALKYIRPLQVAAKPVRKWDKVDSYGYHGPWIGAKLIKTAGRRVIAVNDWQFRTTYNFGKKDGYAQGACGSPVIKNGKVVGLHIGSNFGKYSYVLDFARVSQFLFNQMEGKPSLVREVRVNGQKVLSLSLTQRVSDVEIFRNGEKLTEVCVTLHPQPVDYTRLERVLPALHPGDQLRLRITTDGKDQRDFITYTVPEK